MTPGQKIKQYRKDHNLTQAQLAERLEISRPYMSEIESDKRNMSFKTINKFATKLGIPALELFDAGTYIEPNMVTGFDKQPPEFKEQFYNLVSSFESEGIAGSMKYVNDFVSKLEPNKNEFDDASIELLSSIIKYTYINESPNKNDDPIKIRMLKYIIETINNYQNGNEQNYSKEQVVNNLSSIIDAILSN